MSTKKFHEIFQAEVEAISARRRSNSRSRIELEEESRERDDTPVMRPKPDSNVVGLAMSGGGIRSSAFCLGAVQALHYRKLIDQIDYLSTVSGGGYTGTSMTVAMSAKPNGTFPFESNLKEGEVAGVQHIRNHSNYLFPQGLLNLFSNIVVYLRGLVANVVLLLPWLLLAAAVTIWSNPTLGSLQQTDVVGYAIPLPIDVRYFGLTLNALLAFVLLLAGWALWRSTRRGRLLSDVGPGVRFFGALTILLLVIAFCELQPWVLVRLFDLSHDRAGAATKVMDLLKTIGGFFASIGAAIGFLGRFLADALKRTTEKPGFASFTTRIAIKLAMYVAGAAVPIVLWVIYLYLSFWGIQECPGGSCRDHAPTWLTTLAGWMPLGSGSI